MCHGQLSMFRELKWEKIYIYIFMTHDYLITKWLHFKNKSIYLVESWVLYVLNGVLANLYTKHRLKCIHDRCVQTE